MSSSTVKQFALFAYGAFYPEGGVGDFKGTYSTQQEAIDAFVGPVRYQLHRGGHSDINIRGEVLELSTLEVINLELDEDSIGKVIIKGKEVATAKECYRNN